MATFLGNTAGGQRGVPNVAQSIPATKSFMDGIVPVYSFPYDINGITKDSSGNPLAGCTVQLFRTADDSYVSQYISDDNGYYTIPASNQFSHYLVAYLPGSPDVAGTTVNTLVGS